MPIIDFCSKKQAILSIFGHIFLMIIYEVLCILCITASITCSSYFFLTLYVACAAFTGGLMVFAAVYIVRSFIYYRNTSFS